MKKNSRMIIKVMNARDFVLPGRKIIGNRNNGMKM